MSTPTTPDTDTERDEVEPEDRPPFSAFAASHRYGAFNTEVTNAFADLVAAVEKYDKAGSMTITLKLKPTGSGPIVVTDDVTTKPPTAPKPETYYWRTDDGGLSRRDPRQPELPGMPS